jgi:adenylate cyclase
MIEIERKFLVLNTDFVSESFSKKRIVQGYLNSNPERTVRVRIKGNQGFLTIKGIGNSSGVSRFEWEKEIGLTEAESLLLLCESGVIDKFRYEVLVGKHTFEVDIFEGSNYGLVVAEVELKSENELFKKPTWLGTEVTGEKKYYNAALSQFPFEKW